MFIDGYRRHIVREAKIREFLVHRLSLEPNMSNVDEVARGAFRELPSVDRELFEADWWTFLASLE